MIEGHGGVDKGIYFTPELRMIIAIAVPFTRNNP
jgi:hypothetical protein